MTHADSGPSPAAAALEKMLPAVSIAAEELLGRVMWDAFPMVVGTAFEENYRRAVRAQETAHFEALSPYSQKWLEVHAYPSGDGLSVYFRDVTDRFKDIEERLQQRVIGQRNAIDAVARRLVLNKGPLKDGFDRPDGVLLFLGPTGVGKTELAKSVADLLFGDEKKMIRVDMSEYQDGSVSVGPAQRRREEEPPPERDERRPPDEDEEF